MDYDAINDELEKLFRENGVMMKFKFRDGGWYQIPKKEDVRLSAEEWRAYMSQLNDGSLEEQVAASNRAWLAMDPDDYQKIVARGQRIAELQAMLASLPAHSTNPDC